VLASVPGPTTAVALKKINISGRGLGVVDVYTYSSSTTSGTYALKSMYTYHIRKRRALAVDERAGCRESSEGEGEEGSREYLSFRVLRADAGSVLAFCL
jgi:hypothetical protein